MNITESITFLGQVNSRKCYPVREDEVKKNIPYFEIYKTQLGQLDIRSYGFEEHDNAPRMQLWEMYLKNAVLPNIQDNIDITGFYNIELHDSYTYLKNDKDYTNVMSFAKFKEDGKPILIPDPYMICNWGNLLHSIHDHLPFDSKLDKICFYGTTTGNRNPSQNDRLRACVWSLNKQSSMEFKITKVAQMNVQDIINVYGDSTWKEIYCPRHVSVNDQLKYKYQFWLDGNTCRFDVWPFKTNSLIFKPRSSEMLWYYPLLQSGREFVEITDINKMEDLCSFYGANHHIAKHITSNANNMATELFKPLSHTLYTVCLFEEMANNKA